MVRNMIKNLKTNEKIIKMKIPRTFSITTRYENDKSLIEKNVFTCSSPTPSCLTTVAEQPHRNI